MPELALIELGSNVEPGRNLPRAVSRLRELGKLVAISTVYRTAPFGPPGQPPFLNAAVALNTELDPLPLKRTLRHLEAALGRVRSENRYAPRPIDLDICLYGDRIVHREELTIPDPDLLERPYLAITLAEVAGEVVHPETGETLAQIAARMAPKEPLVPDEDLTDEVTALLEAKRK